MTRTEIAALRRASAARPAAAFGRSRRRRRKGAGAWSPALLGALGLGAMCAGVGAALFAQIVSLVL